MVKIDRSRIVYPKKYLHLKDTVFKFVIDEIEKDPNTTTAALFRMWNNKNPNDYHLQRIFKQLRGNNYILNKVSGKTRIGESSRNHNPMLSNKQRETSRQAFDVWQKRVFSKHLK